MSSELNAQSIDKVTSLFRVLDQPIRLEILLTIGAGEACVCHLEAVLGQRQAYISQHLMALRDADILTTRREGRYVFYRLADQRLLTLIQSAAEMLGVNTENAAHPNRNQLQPGCSCPQCCAPTPEPLIAPEKIPTAPYHY